MPMYVSAASSFVPCPEGAFPAVCVDVVDLGIVESQYGKRQTIRIVWQVDELMENGERFIVGQRYTRSLNDKASLRHHLEAWRGRKFTEAELRQFDLENLLGVCCLLNVVHAEKQGTTYANVASLMPLPRGMAKLAPERYVRVQDRPKEPVTNGNNRTQQNGGIVRQSSTRAQQPPPDDGWTPPDEPLSATYGLREPEPEDRYTGVDDDLPF